MQESKLNFESVYYRTKAAPRVVLPNSEIVQRAHKTESRVALPKKNQIWVLDHDGQSVRVFWPHPRERAAHGKHLIFKFV